MQRTSFLHSVMHADLSNHMPRPLFIIGKHRSGTTWLSNLLLSHPDVAGVEHPVHHGIHESAYFSHIKGRFGDLRTFTNHVECAAVLARSDYFRLAGASFDEIVDLFPTDYNELFRSVMDRFAEERSAAYWIEKSPMHTLHTRQIGKAYPDAQFVGIQRNPVDVAFSSLRNLRVEMSPVRRRLELLRVTLDKYVADRHMLQMQSHWPERVHVVQYEQMRHAETSIIREVCAHLGLEAHDLSSSYQANSSYSTNRQRHARSEAEIAWVRWIHDDILPLIPASVLIAGKEKISHWRRRPLPDWFFRLLNSGEA